MVRAFAGVFLALALVLFARAAVAQDPPRVTLGPFTGSRVQSVREIVRNALEAHSSDIELLAEPDYTAVARRLGVEGMAGDEDVARVGRELRLDAIILGDLSRRAPHGFLLRLRVVRGRDGTALGAASWELRSANEVNSIRNEIWDQLRNYIRPDGARSNDSGGGGRNNDTYSRVEDRTNSDRSSNSDNRSSGGGRDNGSGSVGGNGNDRNGTTAVPATVGLGIVYATLGAGMSQRFWRMPVLGELSPRGYDNSAYPEMRLELMALYRLDGNRIGVGVSGGLFVPLGIQSQAPDPNNPGMNIPLPTRALDVYGGIAAAFRPAGGGFARLQLGIVQHSFTVDTSLLSPEQQLPAISYTGLRLAADTVLPLVSVPGYEVGLMFGTEVRVTNIGTEARMMYGEMASTTAGIGGTAGINVRLDGLLPGFSLRVGAEMLRYRTTFAGRRDVGSGSDSVDDYYRYYLALTYAIGTAALNSRSNDASGNGSARPVRNAEPEAEPEPAPPSSPRRREPEPEPEPPPRPRPLPPQEPARDPFAN